MVISCLHAGSGASGACEAEEEEEARGPGLFRLFASGGLRWLARSQRPRLEPCRFRVGRLDLKLKLWFEYELLLLFSGLCWAARCSAVPTGIPCQVTAATSGSIVPEQADALSVQVASYYSSAV